MRDDPPGPTTLIAYFEEAPDLASRVSDALSAVPGARSQRTAVLDVDWVRRFRESFAAFQVDGFSIVPAWEAPSGRSGCVLVIDPGRAFGTGTHETTRLCLRVLERQLAGGPRPRRVLDLGTGSGILAVAAARLGAAFVAAVDLDPDATASAGHHARLNQVALHLVQGDGGSAFASGVFDLVLANLSAALLIERRAEISRLMAPRATLVLSGLLATDTSALRQAYASLGEPQVHTDGEWVAMVLQRGGRL